MKFNYFTFIIAIISLASCTHAPGTYIAPTPPIISCDTMHMSYSKDIRPILTAYCYQCHSDSVTQNGNLGFDVESFSSLRQYLNQGYRGDGVYGSQFVHILEHARLVIDMPPSYTLDSCSLGKIRNWIKEGANNN